MSVIDNLATTGSVPQPVTDDAPLELQSGDGIEVFALQMVKNDPFVSISEIRKEYAQHNSGRKAGWWKVFRILKRHGLLRKKSRFRYAWGRS